MSWSGAIKTLPKLTVRLWAKTSPANRNNCSLPKSPRGINLQSRFIQSTINSNYIFIRVLRQSPFRLSALGTFCGSVKIPNGPYFFSATTKHRRRLLWKKSLIVYFGQTGVSGNYDSQVLTLSCWEPIKQLLLLQLLLAVGTTWY